MLQRWRLGLLTLLVAASPLVAATHVAATTSSMGMLARVVGGDYVKVTVLAPPNRDVHYLQAKPSMINALRRADLLLAVGAELEVGWLPLAVSSAGNGAILPGQQGYFEAAAQVPLLQAGLSADRALGDIHPMGNPHVNMDPERMVTIAMALAERLSQLDPSHAVLFKSQAGAFATAINARLPQWRKMAEGAPGAILFHQDADYLFALLGVPIYDYIEPLPGIPPTAKHLKQLVGAMQDKRGIILYQSYHPSKGPEFLARELDWPTAALSIDPPLSAGTQDYLALIDSWVEALASVKRL
jgi:zinc/manganese transport system substrate-binding protein